MMVLYSGILKVDLVMAILLVVVVELSIGEINHVLIFPVNSRVMMHLDSSTMSFNFSLIEAFIEERIAADIGTNKGSHCT